MLGAQIEAEVRRVLEAQKVGQARSVHSGVKTGEIDGLQHLVGQPNPRSPFGLLCKGRG